MFNGFKKYFYVFLTIIIAFAITHKAVSEDPTNIRKIPGINDTDKFLHGCVSCHKNIPDKNIDFRLSAIMTEWSEKVPADILAKAQSIAPEGVTLKGKHPYKFNPDTNIPESCNKCHGKSIKAAFPLADLLHVIHFTGDKNNGFLKFYNGECTHCHKMDFKTGKWSIYQAKEGDEK